MSSSASHSDSTGGHFDALAPRYDELRPVDESWWRVFDAIVALGDLRGYRVVEVGAGTGRFAAALAERARARVWAVDASPEMVKHAKGLGVNARVATAESLPFKAGWFDRAVSRMSVHLFDRPRAFAELRRVLAPGGAAIVAITDPAQFGRGWIDPFFPSAAAVDAGRFPTGDELERDLTGAGFASVRLERLVVQNTLPRERALEVVRGMAFSTFALIPREEYEDGLARAEAELPDEIDSVHRWLLVRADA
jgi:SAM-dependent methyltransferase